jgi:glycosyltransferase involved in cell wall biosynthesis
MEIEKGLSSATPKVSVIVPVYNGGPNFERCLRSIVNSQYANYECIVVDDGSTDDSSALAARFPVRLIKLSARSGPAYARNRGAEAATGELLFFIDADVCVYPDTIGRMVATFLKHPEVGAVFGSYDDTPAATNFISQYKNLFHHFVHQTSNTLASTFWSGCGAVKAHLFRAVGGFNEQYGRSSIEDIELGYRLRGMDCKILLNKEVQVKHLKRWTLVGLIRSDIFDRGIPWTILMLQDKAMPNDLNLKISQRISVVLSYLLILSAGFIVLYFQGLLLAPLILLAFVTLAFYWSHDFSPGRKTIFLLLGVMTPLLAIGLVARLLHMLLIIPFVISISAILINYQFSQFFSRRRRLFLMIMLVCLLPPVGFTIWRFPRLLLFPFLVLLAIVLINFRFYVFFARKRTPFFALRALPLHLLYYIYSGISFMYGALVYMGGRFFYKKPQVTL